MKFKIPYFEKFKEMFKKQTDGLPRSKMRNVIIWLIIGVIILIAGSGFGKKNAEIIMQNAEMQSVEATDVSGLERRLEGILSNVRGAGRVQVMIRFADSGVRVLAQDRSQSMSRDGSKSESKGESDVYEEKQDEKTVMSGQGSTTQPIVVSERSPEILGVLVIADGAADETVKYELFEAAKVALGAPAHRVKVTARAP